MEHLERHSIEFHVLQLPTLQRGHFAMEHVEREMHALHVNWLQFFQ
jgi:hypothetical protein